MKVLLAVYSEDNFMHCDAEGAVKRIKVKPHLLQLTRNFFLLRVMMNVLRVLETSKGNIIF